MVIRITITNFKKHGKIAFDVTSPLVLIGPNNSGKTTVLQALCLWEAGLRKWREKRGDGNAKEKTGVIINRKDLMNTPVPNARLLWHDLNVKEAEKRADGKYISKNVKININIEGITDYEKWNCELEFVYHNSESFYCKPLVGEGSELMISEKAKSVKFAFLQPMSGLASVEDKLTPGSIDRKLGEGKTADVLRNICYQILHPDIPKNGEMASSEVWKNLLSKINKLFKCEINEPIFNNETGLIDMSYVENKIEYDLSVGGRGFQQALLLLAYLYSHQGTILLLDEPDAHLEVIRQREIYNVINEVAVEVNSQIIIASHSEVILNEASSSGSVIGIIEGEAVQINKEEDKKDIKWSLIKIGNDKFYQARLKKHIIYFEGTTDYNFIKEFAKKLNHPIYELLSEANVEYAGTDNPSEITGNFKTIKRFLPYLKGVALFDNNESLNKISMDSNSSPLRILHWRKREIENYLNFIPELLKSFVDKGVDLFSTNHISIMDSVIRDNTKPVALSTASNGFWASTKLSDDYIGPIFALYAEKLNIPIPLHKGRYFELVAYMKPEDIDPEVTEKLDLIYEVLKP